MNRSVLLLFLLSFWLKMAQGRWKEDVDDMMRSHFDIFMFVVITRKVFGVKEHQQNIHSWWHTKHSNVKDPP